jgi:ubiquitin-like-conjugating enzyme ATG3
MSEEDKKKKEKEMSNIIHTGMDSLRNLVGKFKGPSKESKFYKEGTLTPEEFITAGDYLTSHCPSWKWCSAKDKFYNNILPKDKQYLKTSVDSYKRADDYLKGNQTKEKVVDGDWVEADLDNKKEEKKEAIDLEKGGEKKQKIVKVENNDDDEDDDFVIEGGDVVIEEEENNDVGVNAVMVKARKYDVTITYDIYYKVPRMWLMGYENGIPLNDSQMREDVMPEYRNKTVTIEAHPCTGERNISVHPCRHSMLLKKMIQDFQNSGKKLEVDLCIVIFLKFLQSVVPTINYDFTMDIAF